jgi:hypothetical protein
MPVTNLNMALSKEHSDVYKLGKVLKLPEL